VDREHLGALLAEGRSLAEIGRIVGRHESTIGYWVARHGLAAAGRASHRARGGLTAAQLQPLVAAGLSVAEIAEHVARSRTTVRYWLRRTGLATSAAAGRHRSAQSQAAREAGLERTRMACVRHGETVFALDGRGYYRCLRCRSEAVTRRRRKLKRILVEEAGGACRACGYATCPGALEFHHLVPTEKRFSLSGAGVTRSLARSRAEARKCVLLCANCHAEVEAGLRSLRGLADPGIQ
jgi:transposase